MSDRNWLSALAFAAVVFMLPGLSDPYYVPRAALVAAVCIPLLLTRRRRRSALELEVIVGVACWSVAAFFSQDRAYSFVGTFGAPFDCFAEVVVAAAVLIGIGGLEVTAADAAEAVVTASMPLSLYAIVQRVLLNRDPFLAAALPATHRVVASQGWPVYLGAVLAIACACAISSLLRRPTKRAAAALLLAVPAMWFTGTRGAVLATSAALFAAVPGRRKWWALAALPVAYLTRLGALKSDIGRIENYRIAWRIFLAHPLTGAGPGAYPVVSRKFITDAFIASTRNPIMGSQHAHNQVLQVLATTGLVGLLGAVVLVVGLAGVSLRSPDRDVLVPACAAYAVLAFVNPIPFSVTVVMALLFGAAAGVGPTKWAPRLPLPLAAGCAASLVISLRLIAADAYMKRAVDAGSARPAEMRAALDMAGRLNPWELRITAMRVDAAMFSRDRKAFAAGVELAHRGVLMHPNDSSAHEIYGRAVLLGAVVGLPDDPREALAAFDRAQQLAPTFTPLMARRRALAHALGLEAQARSAQEDLDRVQTIEKGGS